MYAQSNVNFGNYTRQMIKQGLGNIFYGLVTKKIASKPHFIPQTLSYCTSNFAPINDSKKKKVILGIETSCDDSAVGVVRSDGHVLADCSFSQLLVHSCHGGIVPSLARDEHMKNLPDVLEVSINHFSGIFLVVSSCSYFIRTLYVLLSFLAGAMLMLLRLL